MLALRADSLPIVEWVVWYYSQGNFIPIHSGDSTWANLPKTNVLAVEWLHDGLRTITHGVDYYALTALKFGGSDNLNEVQHYDYLEGVLIPNDEYNNFLSETLKA